MKQFRLLTGLLAVAFAISTLTLINGCKKSETPAGVSGKKIVSAEKTSFDEVTSKLDPGGNFYLYLSTEQWLKNISTKVAGWRQLVDSLPDQSATDRENVGKGFDVLTRLIKDSGIEDVSGVGMSSIAREPGFYSSKAVLHHYKGDGSGFLWNMFGDKAHPLTGLDLLPTTTAVALFSDTDVALLWSVIQKEVKGSGFPEAEKLLNEAPAQFEQMTGVKWDALVASLGGEFGVVLTLDESRKIPVPLPTAEPLEIPEPGLMVVIKVNDDTIFNRVDQALKDMGQQPVSVNNAKLKMRTIPVPLPLPVQVRPSLASSGGYLILANSDTLIQQALDVRDGKIPGLKSTDEFKHLAQDLPTEGNQFCFISQRFGQTYLKLQQQVLQMEKDTPAAAKRLAQSMFNPNLANATFSVSVRTDEGWMMFANGSQNGAQVFALSAVALPVGLLSAIAIPNFVKARQTAQANACRNNLRMIDAAKAQWALENRKRGTDYPTESDITPYLKNGRMPTCPTGGRYTLNSVDNHSECTAPGHYLSN